MTIPKSYTVVSPAPKEIWKSLMRKDPESLPYQSPQWFDCILASGKYKDTSRYYSFKDGQELIMPMVRKAGLSRFLGVESSPPSGWGMGGLISAQPIRLGDMQTVFRDLIQRKGSIYTSIRPNPRAGEVWAQGCPPGITTIPRLAHVIDLEGGFSKVWEQKFRKKTRNIVRRAERNSRLSVEVDTTGKQIGVFYDLLKLSFDRWAKQQNEPQLLAHIRNRQRDSLQKFETISKTLKEGCRIYVAKIDGVPAAASVTLQFGNVNDSKGAMDKELVGNSGANYLLQSMAIEEACKAGCRYYHLGESGNSTRLAHFKTRFGAAPFSYSEYKIEKLPLTKIDQSARKFIKKIIGFKD